MGKVPTPFSEDASANIVSTSVAEHVFVIAEAGINHNGDIDIARRLIDLAKQSGCDAVKFQKRTIDLVYPPQQLAQPRESPWGTTLADQKRALEFGEAEYDEIDGHCHSLNLPWFASAWDEPSLCFLDRYDCPYNKVSSAMVAKLDFVEHIARRRKPTFLSTGMSTWADIDRAVAVFRRHECPVVLMHSVSEYPCPEDRLNLLMIPALRARYGLPVGYSGHEASVSPSVVAAVLGAVAIERHVTLDRAMYGSDQAASLEKPGLDTLVAQLRKLPVVLGDGVKRVTPGDEAMAKKLRYWL